MNVARFVLCALLVLPIFSHAGYTTAQPASQPGAASDEAAIRALEEQERLGVLNRDPQVLELVWSEHFMVNAPINRVSPDREVVLDLMQQGLIHYASFDRRIEHIRIDGDIAVVMGAETVQPVGEAPRAGETMERRFTHVWKKDEGVWRLIARHANNIAPE